MKRLGCISFMRSNGFKVKGEKMSISIQIKKILVSLVASVLVFGTVEQEVYSDAASSYINLSAKAVETTGTETTVRLKWQKPSDVVNTKVYCASCISKSRSSGGEYKYVFSEYTNVGNTTNDEWEFSLSFGKTYKLKVVSYVERDDSIQKKYVSNISILYTGISIPSWIGYNDSNEKGMCKKTTPNSISLTWFQGGLGSIASEGFEIYRKGSGESYSRISTLDYESDHVNQKYVDYNIKPFRIYSYKIRAFKQIGDSTYYSPYSKEIKLYTADGYGSYVVKSLSKESGSLHSVKICIKAKKSNGTTKLYTKKNDGIGDYLLYDYSNLEETCLKLSSWSLDGKKWYSVNKKAPPVLKRNGKIYIKLCSKNKKGFKYNPSKWKGKKVHLSGTVKYNGEWAKLDLNFSTMKAVSEIDDGTLK